MDESKHLISEANTGKIRIIRDAVIYLDKHYDELIGMDKLSFVKLLKKNVKGLTDSFGNHMWDMYVSGDTFK